MAACLLHSSSWNLSFLILICITYSSPTALQKSHGHSTPLKSSGQNKRGEQRNMFRITLQLSSETILSLLTPVTRQQTRGSFIYILLHHVQTKTLEKRAWLTSSSLDWWKVLLSCGSSQSARASELSTKWKWTKKSLCGQNQTSHAWQGRRVTLSRSLSPSSSQPGHTNTAENRPPHHWIKKWFRTEQRRTTLPSCTVLHSTGIFPKYKWGLLGCAVLTHLPNLVVPVNPATLEKPFSIWACSGKISLKLSKILLHFQVKCSSSHVHLEPQHEKYLILC